MQPLEEKFLDFDSKFTEISSQGSIQLAISEDCFR